MSQGIQCFMLERTDLFREELRRYRGDGKCEQHPFKYHNADVVICEAREVPEITEPECGGGDAPCFGIHISQDDQRWPSACVCGYAFQPKDTWQHHFHRLLRLPCRHKNPDGSFTVDNIPEPGCTTCTAGAGSILTPKWHGFLRNGKLITC